MMKPTTGKAEFDKARTRRAVCEPSGGHRLDGPERKFRQGVDGETGWMRQCRDCGFWYESDLPVE